MCRLAPSRESSCLISFSQMEPSDIILSAVKEIVSSVRAATHAATLSVVIPARQDPSVGPSAASVLRISLSEAAVVSLDDQGINVEWDESNVAEVVKSCGGLLRRHYTLRTSRDDRHAVLFPMGVEGSHEGGDNSMLERTFVAARRAAEKSESPSSAPRPPLPSFSSEGVVAHVRSTVEGGAERNLAAWLMRPPPTSHMTSHTFLSRLASPLAAADHSEADGKIKSLLPFFWGIEWQSFQSDPGGRQGQAFLTLTDGHGIFLCICIRYIPLVKKKKFSTMMALPGRLGLRALSDLRRSRGGKGSSSVGSTEDLAIQRRRHKRWSVAKAALDFTLSMKRGDKIPPGSVVFAAILTSEMEGIQVTSRDKESKGREEVLMLELLGQEGCVWPTVSSIAKKESSGTTKSKGSRKKGRGKGRRTEFSTASMLTWIFGGDLLSTNTLTIGTIILSGAISACFFYQTVYRARAKT